MKVQISLTMLLAVVATVWASHQPDASWIEFLLFVAAVLISTPFKVALPRGDGTMSLNFPFILLAIVQLSPLQVLLLSAISIIAQCRVRVKKIFTAIQIVFNVANTMLASMFAFITFAFLTSKHVVLPPALATAALSYFFWSTGSVAAIIASSNGERTFRLWKSEFPWYFPFYMVGAVLAASAHWIAVRYGWATSVLLVPMVYTVYRAYMAQIARAKEREQHLLETEALHQRTIEGLAMAIEAKDQNTHDHLFRVRNYVEEVAKAMNLPEAELKALHTAAFLHDIGKLAVPEHIINKPGKLTPEEFEKIKIHPVVGADILERVRFPYPVVPIVRSHHEWWNGAGYPDGLKGEEIPIGARVLTVVDCFDALVSDRPYRKGMPSDQAFAIVESLAGTQFDPVVVKILGELYPRLERPEEIAASNSFTALNTEVEVERGLAPGAGFASAADEAAPKPAVPAAQFAFQQIAIAGTSLDLIAAASQEAQALFEMSQALGGSLRINETISVIASRLRRLIPFDSCAVYMVQGDVLFAQYIDGENTRSFSAEPIPFGQGISGWVAQSGKPILNGNAGVEPNYHSKHSPASELQAALSIPLVDLEEKIFAVLTLYSSVADSFQRDHLRVLQAMESKVSLSLQNALRFRRTEIDSTTDVLTSLPNTRGLFKHLETELARASEAREPMAVAVCDLNAFNEVTDRCGHHNGNILLGLVAEAFSNICSPDDIVGRIGGGEFGFVLRNTTRQMAEAQQRMIAAAVVSASRRCIGVNIKVTASVGLAFYPSDGTSAEELLAAADRRMYADKRACYERDLADQAAQLRGVDPRFHTALEFLTV